MFLVDSHCHLNFLDYKNIHKDVTDVIAKAAARDVKFILAVATTLEGYKAMTDMIGDHPDVAYSCGVHPLHLHEETKFNLNELYQFAADARVLAIGETGLDYFYNSETKNFQQKSFREHIGVGRYLNKPIIIHTRNAINDTLSILKEEEAELCGGVVHCFTEDYTFAKKILDMGFYISFSGIATFRNAQQIRESICYVPLDRILIETDSPYLAPVPYRGKENQPAYTRDIAECIAMIKQVNINEIAKATTKNFSRLFNLSMIL